MTVGQKREENKAKVIKMKDLWAIANKELIAYSDKVLFNLPTDREDTRTEEEYLGSFLQAMGNVMSEVLPEPSNNVKPLGNVVIHSAEFIMIDPS